MIVAVAFWEFQRMPVLPIDPQSSFGGAAYAQWYASNGAAGIKPTDPEPISSPSQ